MNRFCSSSIDAISIGALKIAAGQENAIVAGGIEMMSRVPILSDQAKAFIDPAFAAQCQMLMMGSGADLIATLNDVTREQADAIAVQSQQRAAHAREQGYFKSIVPIYNPVKSITVSEDECIRGNATIEALAELPPRVCWHRQQGRRCIAAGFKSGHYGHRARSYGGQFTGHGGCSIAIAVGG